jgi:hypothetical protein
MSYYVVFSVAQLVEVLRYKPKVRGFDSQWCHCKFFIDYYHLHVLIVLKYGSYWSYWKTQGLFRPVMEFLYLIRCTTEKQMTPQ